jgi:hypothetical protein
MEFSPAFHVAKCRQQCQLLATPPSILEKPQSAGLLPCMALLTLPKMIGGAIGAAGGAAVGAIVGGSPTIGAAVGGAAGTATGALWEDIKKALR